MWDKTADSEVGLNHLFLTRDKTTKFENDTELPICNNKNRQFCHALQIQSFFKITNFF